MKLECGEYYLRIIPENDIEAAYLKMSFGLEPVDSEARLRRVNNVLGNFKYLEMKRPPERKVTPA